VDGWGVMCLIVFGSGWCFDPARSIGVDGWGVWCVFVWCSCFELGGCYILSYQVGFYVLSWCLTLGVYVIIYYTIHYYILLLYIILYIILLYLILYYTLLFFLISSHLLFSSQTSYLSNV
jgi:hypothetical protein